MFNTTVEVAGYEAKDKKNDAWRVIRLNRTHVIDATAFSPDTPKGRAMVAITTIRDSHIIWHDNMASAEDCVAVCLPGPSQDPVNQITEQIIGSLAELIESLGGIEHILSSNRGVPRTEDEEPAEPDESIEEASDEDKPS